MKKLVMDTLKPLGIPVRFQYYTGTETTYITFFEYAEPSEQFADGKETIRGHYIQVDIWSKSNYSDIQKQIEKLLDSAGFIRRAPGPEMYEEETKIFHKALRYLYYEYKTIN